MLHHLNFLITGCARCGSNYTVSLMECLGFSMLHEQSLSDKPASEIPDGVASWIAAEEEGRKEAGIGSWDWCMVFTRHPVNAINTLLHVGHSAKKAEYYYSRVRRLLPEFLPNPEYDNPAEMAALRYVTWYEHILENLNPDLVFPAENGLIKIVNWMDSQSIDYEWQGQIPSKQTHTRRSKYEGNELSADQIKAKIPGELWGRVFDLSCKFEYTLEYPPKQEDLSLDTKSEYLYMERRNNE